ncbi:cholecystokinin receptor type A-like [Cylas formicarius]|uniref:cholecystokinin receptor type A-like n=1 Tax=Cylas formicarius TaxID=197179 RepID=UPI002958AD08|nr:cholecystokinin receptor type A-like [Cylas formicarius]
MSAVESQFDYGFPDIAADSTTTSSNYSLYNEYSGNNASTEAKPDSEFLSQIMVPLYLIIFVLSMVGNTFVLVTLIRDRRMRTVTNVYLLNLALADLLLGVFCMPFTLVGQVLRNFIFGERMCKLIPYFQAVSVSVAVWTLVAISMERYFAICRPLKSRRWQTRSRASKIICVLWIISLSWNLPILAFSTLQATKRGYKCRELWPSYDTEVAFNLILDAILLLIPLIIMSLAYFMIIEKLWKGLQREMEQNSFDKFYVTPINDEILICSESGIATKQTKSPKKFTSITTVLAGKKPWCNLLCLKSFVGVQKHQTESNIFHEREVSSPGNSGESSKFSKMRATQRIRSNFMDKSIEAKKKVIRMLFVIVADFFICWAPLHVLNTFYLFYPEEVYENIGSTGIALIQLLAYTSACSNPIIYCFMNKKYRHAFLVAFGCKVCCKENTIKETRSGKYKKVIIKSNGNNSNSGNESVLRFSNPRSELIGPEAEDRV